MNNLKELMVQYENKFGDIFPRMNFMGYTQEELCNIISKCLKDNKPVKESKTIY